MFMCVLSVWLPSPNNDLVAVEEDFVSACSASFVFTFIFSIGATKFETLSA